MKNFINSAITNGDILASVRELQVLPVPPAAHRGWEPECLLRFPENPKVFMSNFTLPGGEQSHVFYVVVEVVFPDGTRQLDKAFLSTLVKTVFPVGCPPANNQGTFVDYVRQFPNWAEAIAASAGMTVKVVSVDTYRVSAPGGRSERTATLYGLDIV